MEHSFGDTVAKLSAGDYFIVDYGTSHQYKAVGTKRLNVINFLFYPDFVDRTLGRRESFEKVVNSYSVRFRYQSLNRSPTGVAFSDESGDILHIVRQIEKEYTEKQEGFLECIRCLVVQMFILIMRRIGGEKKAQNESAIVREIVRYIAGHYAEPISLSELAAKYNYSLSHISKKFAKETGCGFTQYLQRIRIEQSCRLLETGDYFINEVADLVGYGNAKSFNKVFKETLGITPQEFKRLKKPLRHS
jgi:YesN/AraC family two-component response regulator